MVINAIFYDGKTAKDRSVSLTLDGTTLLFSSADVAPTRWTIAGLHPIDAPSPGQPFRLTHDAQPGARLILHDETFVQTLVTKSRHLKGGYSGRDVSNIFGWTLGGLAVVAAMVYLSMTYLPDRVAQVLPEKWRNKMGKDMEQSVVEGARICSSPVGDAALGTLIGNLAQGAPDMPPISVHVYDIPILNAFAVPGGNIIMTRELLEKADAPEEIAGILAHEIGHVYFRHPEMQAVRLAGMDVLTSIFTGTKGGTMTTNMAVLATLLRYSREAEAEADSYAEETLVKASIDPIGLKTFFTKILKLEADMKVGNSTFQALGNLFSTHPGTEDRIKLITPLPAGQKAIPALTAEQWKALKSICEK